MVPVALVLICTNDSVKAMLKRPCVFPPHSTFIREAAQHSTQFMPAEKKKGSGGQVVR